MGTRLHLEAHLSAAELERRYRAAKEPHERSWWQILWLLATGHTAAAVAEVTGYSRYWIGQLVKRYNTQRPAGMRNRQRTTSWRARPMLTGEQQEELRRALAGPTPDGERRWTARAIAAWMSAKLGRPVRVQRGWDYLQRLRHSQQLPRPSTRWSTRPSKTPSKNFRPLLRAVAAAFPQGTAAAWAMDEHRIGLKQLLHRVWAPIGQRPIARVQHRFRWRYLVSFVHPASGRTVWHLASGASIPVFEAELAAFAHAVGAGPQEQIVLVLDQAGWHTSLKLRVPDHLHLLFLPPYSPELQPAEHMWPLTNDALVNAHFADLDALEEAQLARCAALQRHPERIRSATLFPWWPRRIRKRQGPRRN